MEQRMKQMNKASKTKEELQVLIEKIPYPTEDLSMTSFSNSKKTSNKKTKRVHQEEELE